MILTCPACATRYRVAEEEFEVSSGRTVRCANCGYLWHETLPAQQPPQSIKPPIAAAEIAEVTSSRPSSAPPSEPPAPAPRLEIPAASRPAPRVRSLAGRTAALAALVIAAAIAWVLLRGHFAVDRPSPASLQAATDHPAPVAGFQTGLVIRKVTPVRAAGGLVVDGEIVNPGNVPRDVPRLRVSLQNSAKKEVRSETVDPPKLRLQPGEVVHFETPFAHPPDTATGVVVSFASS